MDATVRHQKVRDFAPCVRDISHRWNRNGSRSPDGRPHSDLLGGVCFGTVRRVLKPVIEVLAGIPSVLYGYFALLFVTPLLQKFIPSLSGFNALSPGIVLAFMVLPTIASLSEDIIYAVPQSIREASLALGATKLQTTFRAVLPAAGSGIIAACLLGFSRAIGETMLVTIAAGQMPNLTLNPLEPVETMTAYIVQVSLGDVPHGSLEYRTIFAVGLTLFLITLIFNLFGLFLRERFIRTFQRFA